MKTLLTLLLTIGLVTAVPSSPLRADTEEALEGKELGDDDGERAYLEYLENKNRLQANLGFGFGPYLGLNLAGGLGPGLKEEKEDEEEEDYNTKLEEAYQDLVESQKRFLKVQAAANLGSIGGFKLGAGLGSGQTGVGAGGFFGPLGFNVGGGLGLQQGGLGGGVQLGSLGLGASTGYSNGHIGFGGNAGFGNNFLTHGTKFTPAPYVYARSIDPQARHVCTYARHLCTRQLPLVARQYYGPYY